MNKHSDNLRIKAHAGFSLVEIMVGMIIALLSMIIVAQVFSVSEGVKRTTTGGGDALQNGASALFELDRSVKEAGYGIFSSTNLPPLPADPVGTAPVVITPGAAANASDSITLMYRKSPTNNPIYEWNFGSSPPDPGAFPAAVPPALTIETISVNAQAQLVSNTVPDAPPYPTVPPPEAATSNVISDGIVLLKAVYGVDANGNGVIDIGEWTPVAPANVLSVYAVRIAVVARSAQPEKPSAAGGVCNTTTTFPTWVDSATAPLDLSGNVGLAATDDWKCYRYKTFENSVPLRNALWRP